jgi:hypothetical protein
MPRSPALQNPAEADLMEVVLMAAVVTVRVEDTISKH